VSGFRGAVKGAVEELNRYHGAEARVRIVKWPEDGFVAEFESGFCLTCGFYDYFGDLARPVRELGYKVGTVRIEEFEEGALVKYRMLKGEQPRTPPEELILIFGWKYRDI
jgi:hypothetical protein